MTITTVSRALLVRPMSLHAANRSSLLRLYLTRGMLALVWAAAFAKAHEVLDALTITLLVIYPLIDAVSSMIDYSTTTRDAERRITQVNVLLSTAAAIALGLAGCQGMAAVLAVFGAWAVIVGAAQWLLGPRRRGRELGQQWPMLIAGGLSFLVGASFGWQSFGDQPSLALLSVYATAGGVFFIIQAGLLAWRAHQRRYAAN